MEIAIDPIKEEELSVLNNLFEFAAYDLSEFSKANIKKTGLYEPKINVADLYNDNNYYLYMVRAEEQLAGFVIVKYMEEENLHYLNHFFILRKYRKQGIGRKVAEQVFDMFKGRWRVSEFDWNVSAQMFWRKVLERYTGGAFIETRRADNKGPAQQFSNHNTSES
ncbi:GNAT family N-acetyltransferase [Paenibacillus mesophilus]|uniref:GNAT family N-acetyltransferase n=1 Tax=Paenibacillus mesophilus TaxID=2582849 RepID=UPI00110D7A9B|nr:GNAT family N-acetyltransferase [Paenibacillus mesophilus]TMV43392.1 GNAT family N-acetyltransferase [Paenibacillus mesophilus]